MPTLDDAFDTIRSALVAAFGRPPSAFAGLAPFEAMIAVLLARTLGESSWRAALDGLDEAGLLTPESLAQVEIIEIGDAVREKGRSIAPEKLAPLRHLARWLVDHHGGCVDSLQDPHRSTEELREELASIKGVGIKGADAILLHVLKRPSYPVDRATYRVLVRHGWLEPTATYEEARDLLIDHTTGHADLGAGTAADSLADLAHDLDALGRRFCRAAAPHCDGCPLESLLPESGPRGALD
jgi:endonuclease-3 related protein